MDEHRLNATARVKMDDGELLLNRWNSKLFTFIGNLASRNHIYVQTEEDEGRYLFNMDASQEYGRLLRFMSRNQFPMDLNNGGVSDEDEAAYQRAADQVATWEAEHLSDTFPDNWIQ